MLQAKILKKRTLSFNSMHEFMLCISGVDCIEDIRIYAALKSVPLIE